MFRPGQSFQIARIAGIRIGVAPSWFLSLFILIVLFSPSFQTIVGGTRFDGYLIAVGLVLAFYASLVLHELGHAFAAKRQGIAVERIDLSLIGGMAMIAYDPKSPGREFAVAAAGPAVTAIIVGICVLIGALLRTPGQLVDAALLQTPTTVSPAFALVSFLAIENAFLLALNLLPGFPLDGGRMLLAIAWKLTGDRARAQRIAGRAGQGLAVLLGAWGLYLLAHGAYSGLWALAIAWLIGQSARLAVAGGQVHRLTDVTVSQVMDPHPLTLPAEVTLLDASERVFEPHGWLYVAVTEGDGRFAGVLRRQVVEQELAAGRPALTAREAADREPDWLVLADAPLRAALAADALPRHGAIFAVDRDGRLRGVLTLEAVRRAFAAAPSR